MTSTDQVQDRWRPESDAERQQVREQLHRLLASHSFQSSKRYPNLLRFVVEQTLEGHEDQLKERSLGVQVFQRSPDYDTNQDPVVRLSAAEVRKRIALYYQQPQHQHELVIGLNSGSYIPFFLPARVPVAASQAEVYAPPVVSFPSGPRRPWALVLAVALLPIAGALFLGWRILVPANAQDSFWAPILHSPSRVTLCVGSPSQLIPTAPAQASPADSPLLPALMFLTG